MPQNTAHLDSRWPVLPPLADWQDTCATVHMWTQVVGKVRLALAPLVNHWWSTTLYTTPRGLTTSLIHGGSREFSIDFDFVRHALWLNASDGGERSFSLEPMPVADFYRKTMRALGELGVDVHIFPRPVEIPEAIRFEADEVHRSYDPDAMQRFFRALLQADRVFNDFRARFLGKVSPVHFFWGAFDLAVTRFSGRTAPKHEGGIPNCPDWVMHEAYSHEVSSAGFWPGTGFGEAAFYSYAYPMPSGFESYSVKPDAARFDEALGEFILPYEAVRTARDPDRALLSFLQTTYEAAAELAKWDRPRLERTASE